MSHPRPDIIDLLAGIEPGSHLASIRDHRAQARENAQISFEALLEPDRPGDFSYAERYAVAAFVSGLHGFAEAVEFYADLLGDADEQLVPLVLAAAQSGATRGPYGVYREPKLADESVPGLIWVAADEAPEIGARLGAALSHAHLLVFRPRESSPEALQNLVDAGWSADDIVSLSQLIAFLSFQLRAAWGLRALARNISAAPEGANR